MKYFGLIWAGLFRKKARTFLTLASLFMAFLLFGLLQAVNSAFSGGVSAAGAERLVTNGRYSIIDMLPISHANQISSVTGVAAVTHSTWFGGTYQTASNFFPKIPVDPDEYFAMFPEIEIADEQLQAFQQTRSGVIVARALAQRFGWSLGDRIPIIADIWPPQEGNLWEFDLVGLYDLPPDSNLGDQMFINFDYFDENRRFGRGLVGWFTSRVDDPQQSAEVSAAIDQVFMNSNNETKTATENDFFLSFARQVGDIGLIVTAILGAVFFTIALVTANTMSQGVRERIPELAVLKTLGFTDRGVLGLVLSESLLMTLFGATLGLLAALLITPGVAGALRGFLPGMNLTGGAVAIGLGLAALLAIVIGLPPALRAMRLNVVDALGGR